MIVLAGDIGGTNSRLAIFDSDVGLKTRMIKDKYKNRDYDSFYDVLADFLKLHNLKIDVISISVAGPVFENHCSLTNLGWDISGKEISEMVNGAKVFLINDMVGMSSFVPHIKPNQLININKGTSHSNGNIGVIAPGTGLGQGFLVWQSTHYNAFPSEGGHSDFAPVSPLQTDLHQYLNEIYDHVSFENVCSGMAVPDIYNFLLQSGTVKDDKNITNKIEQIGIKSRTIFYYAQSMESEICQMTVKLFVEILGAEAGNLALKIFSKGGIFIGGGIVPRIIPQMRKYFMNAFIAKGRFTNFMEQIPVNLIIHKQPALYGAAFHALQLEGLTID